MSPSHDQKHGVAQENSDNPPDTSIASSTSDMNAEKAPTTTKDRAQTFDDEQDLEFDEALSDEEDAEIPDGSLFDYHIPGVLTLDEVKRLDLDHWRLLVRNALIELEVSYLPSDH